MTNYIDSEDYEIEKKIAKKREAIAKKRKKQKLNRIISLLTTFNIVIGGVGITSAIVVHENPFDGYSISSSDFNFKYKALRSRNMLNDESIKESLDYLKSSDIEEKKAYALYYAIISNYNFKKEEKKALSAYINYAIDNKYLNYENVYNSFTNLSIKRNIDLGNNIVGQYNGYNEIRLSNKADSSTLFHELCHSDKGGNLPLWFEEGITELISNEYYDSISGVYCLNKNVIRILCEIIGKEDARDLFFQIEGTGNFNLLTEVLIKKGIDKKLCEELYDALEEYHYYQSNNELKTKGASIISTKVRGCLSIMFDTTHSNSNYGNGVVDKLLTSIDINLDEYKFYYLNSKKIEENKNFCSIKYYYPVTLCDNINGICEGIQVGQEKYVKISDEMLDNCNKSKLMKSVTYYNDESITNYIIDGNNKIITESNEKISKNLINMFKEKYEEIDIKQYVKYPLLEKENKYIEKNK